MNVHVPRDKITNEHQNYGFVEFKNEEDADYAIKIMHMIKLFGRPIHVNKASQDKRTQEVGANLFVGNLNLDVDEKTLRDVFCAFGIVLSTKVMRDPESGESKNYGFVSYDNFESADQAVNTMNGQYIGGVPVDVSYAYKKDTKGERHGSTAERILAAKKPNISSSIMKHTTGMGAADNMKEDYKTNYAAPPPPPSMPPMGMYGGDMPPPGNMPRPPPPSGAPPPPPGMPPNYY
jgi:splicing factor 3B subunit 4